MAENAITTERPRYWPLLVLLLVLATLVLVSLRAGALPVSTADAVQAMVAYNPDSYEQAVVRELRLPRTLVGIAVGAALAVSGAAMQAVTRNPLAGPSILGVNAGAAFAIVAAIYLGGLTQPLHYIWFAFAGGLGVAVLVYLIGSAGGGASPGKLALAGVIVSTLLGSLMTALLLIDQQTLDIVRFWLVGSIGGRELSVLAVMGPFLAIGIVGTVLLGHQLNVLALGDEMARSLGMSIGTVRFLVAVLVVLSSGASVAIAGPIAFVGLAVPHIVRGISGPDYRMIVLHSLVAGPIVLVAADIVGRLIARPAELQVGIVTAMVGAPVLIALARRQRAVELS